MKIKVGDNVLIDVSDGRNYTLFIKQDVINVSLRDVQKSLRFWI